MGKSWVVFLCSVVLATSANHGGAGEAPAADASVSDLSWLAGYWKSDKRDALMEECWLPPSGGVMLGLHRDVHGAGRASFEYLRIVEAADGVYYYATPLGGHTTKFTLTLLSEDGESKQAVFENPEHDFPQLIRYSLNEHGLMAEVEGVDDDQPVIEVWVWKRAEFPRVRYPSR